MQACIISIGHELITGQCVDTNAAWISQELVAVGVQVVAHLTVDDDRDRIRATIQSALESADLVILTGGLGPTADDLTRYAIADLLESPLDEDEDTIAHLEEMFRRWQRTLHGENRVQALIPRGCRAIPNPKGTAPGIACEVAGKRLFAFPGVPAEMKAMFQQEVTTTLRSEVGPACTRIRRLLCFGMSEAKLGGAIEDLMARGRNPTVGTTASEGVISVRIAATAATEAEAEALLVADESVVHERLGKVVFGQGETTLAAVVGGMLADRGKTLATAESCTGGLLAALITDIPGSSDYFLQGYVTYSNESKHQLLNVPEELITGHGAVSEEVARSMAIGCRDAAGADFALATTGIAGPGGGHPPDKPVGLVYIGLAEAAGVTVKRILVGEHLNRTQIRDRSCKVALNLLRLNLLES